MTTPIIYIAGKDPVEDATGHSNYVRAHARAALAGGFEPHLFLCEPREWRGG